MRQTTLAAGAAACLLAFVGMAHAQDYRLGALRIENPWSLPAPAGAPTAAGYLTVTNTGKTPDRLLGATTPAADRVEIHSMTMDGAIMRMRPVPEGLAIQPGQTLTIAPGGYHLMLIGPKRAFAVGDRIPGVLRFEHAGTVAVAFHVQTAPPDLGEHSHGEMR
jgi:copper(I)-binding protein